MQELLDFVLGQREAQRRRWTSRLGGMDFGDPLRLGALRVRSELIEDLLLLLDLGDGVVADHLWHPDLAHLALEEG